MFNRPHHQRIAKLLHALNSDILSEAQCYLSGVREFLKTDETP
jgi:hypothetical protein